jgi:hypothetical protein
MSVIFINPYRLGVPWTPAAITTALWLDAADASTVTTVSSAVSQWNDKSGNGRNAEQSTAANRPAYQSAAQNGLNVLTFDGSNDWLSLPNAAAPSGANGTFAACKPTHGVTGLGIITRAYYWGSWYLNSTGFGATARYNVGRAGTDDASAIVTGLTNSTDKILSGTYDNINASLSVNGGTAVNTAYTPNIFYNVNDRPTIGAFRDSNNLVASLFNGPMYEIIVVHSAPSTDTRQRIEGYLAHKWALTAGLPADHPFKTAAPTL